MRIMNMGKRSDNALRAAYCSGGYDDERRPRRGRRREGGRRRRREQEDTGRKADGVSGIGLQQFQSRVASKIEEIVREVDPSIELVMCKMTSAPRYRRPPAFKIVLDTNWDANGPDARGIMDGTQLAVLSSAIRERIINQEGSDATNSIGDDDTNVLPLPASTSLEFSTAGRRRPLTKVDDLSRFAGHRAIIYLHSPASLPDALLGGAKAVQVQIKNDKFDATVIVPRSRRKVRGVLSHLAAVDDRQFLIMRDEDQRESAGPPLVAIGVGDCNFNRSHIEPLGVHAGPVNEKKTRRTKLEQDTVRRWIEEQAAKARVVVFAKSYCPHCKRAIAALRASGIDCGPLLHLVNLEDHPSMNSIQLGLRDITGAGTVPRVFVDGACIGGGEETMSGLRFIDGPADRGGRVVDALAALAAQECLHKL